MSNTNIVYPEHFHGCMSMNKSWAPCQTGGSLGCRARLHGHCHSGLGQLGCFVKLASMGILALAYVALGALGQDLSQGKFYGGVHGLGSLWLWFLLRIFIQGCAFVQLPFMALDRGDCFQFILLGLTQARFPHLFLIPRGLGVSIIQQDQLLGSPVFWVFLVMPSCLCYGEILVILGLGPWLVD